MSLLHASRPAEWGANPTAARHDEVPSTVSVADSATALQHADLRIWFEGGVPYGLVWEGRYYRVTDTPTHLEDEFVSLTHPLDLVGWRFQGTNDDEQSRMFDIRRFGDDWVVLRVYE